MMATPRGAATTWPQWIALSLYGLALTMTSNIVDPPWLSQKASQLAGPGWQNTLLGSVAFIGLVWAALVQPIFGARSDQLRSPWGRRKPFLWLGSLLLALALALLVAAPSVPMLILALLLVQTFSNMVQAAYQGLIPDHVPEDRRGRASGIKGFMEIPAVVIGPLVAGYFLGRGQIWGPYPVLLGVYLAVGLITAAAVPSQALAEPPSRRPTWIYQVDWSRAPTFAFWLAHRLVFWWALLTLRTFLIFFLRDTMGLTMEQAQSLNGTLSAILGAMILLLMVPAGALADRWGTRPLLRGAGVLAGLGTFGFLAVSRLVGRPELPALVAASLVIGIGVALFVAASWTWITRIVPPEESARYLGLGNMATALGSAIARLSGPAIDAINRSTGGLMGYDVVYGLAGLLFLGSLLLARPPAGAVRTRSH
ncbi:MFS transporter [Thermoflexus sp.]|jgi:MFS family permease|uniref:MFS transporter n=1 Tax=Thermoflexus sp. TaxID=1969742 RepID=UPI003C737B92